ncbi:MAG TPA: threonine synthase [Flexilinea sp.]|nr:threonine synthase [Flexilinea sp.]HPS48094.1 threonine synthase [Flexilinea sp.]
MSYQGIIHRYHEFMDLPPAVQPITLYEGNTPLIPVPAIADNLGGGFELYVKYEGLNPTGSFKDRGMTTAMTMAKHNGKKTVICASTGNTAASAAAYASRAGLRAIVMIPEGKVAAGKLAGAVAYGAEIIQIPGSFDDALSFVVEISQKSEIELVNSLNPYRMEGQKTASFEICDELGSAPDWLCLPVGNAGNITAYWMGFTQYNRIKNTGLPHILGVQAEGAAPLVIGHTVEHPETVATAIRIGNPARGEQALMAAEESKGRIIAVSDEKILAAQKMLASSGIWVEPASAAGLAGLIDRIKNNSFDPKGKRIVLVCTGHGMKDPDIIISRGIKPVRLPVDFDKVAEYILGGRIQ